MRKSRGAYRKPLELEYRFIDSSESSTALNNVFDSIFDKLYKSKSKSKSKSKPTQYESSKEEITSNQTTRITL